MKKILLGCAILGLTMGCVSIKVKKPDGTEYSYHRWIGSQNLEDVSVTTPDGVSFHIGKQSGVNSLDKTLENVSATLKNLSEVSKRAAGLP